MPNTLNLYDPLFYANEALIQLEKALGLAGRVHRGYDADAQQKGSTIKIRNPATFTAQDAPSTAQDINTGETSITLDNWREVKFGLTDKELTFTKEDIIREHIRPAAYALADDLDQKLAALYKDVPWYFDQAAGTIALTDLANVRKVLRDNKVPMKVPGTVHLMVDSAAEAGLIGLPEFNRVDATGTDETLREGTLARRFGMDIFVNQNTASHTPGVSADATGALTANAALGATTIAFDSITAAGTIKKGDSFTLAGDTQRYVFTEDKTASGGAITSVGIFPALKKAATSTTVITIRLDTHVANLAFHRNAFALATAPLSEMGDGLGARIASVADPVTGLSLRSRIFYEGNNSKVFVALDILYGFKTLDPNLAARLCS